MSAEVAIVPLTRSSKNITRFLRVSYRIYRDDAYWVAPILQDLKKVFLDSNPLFEHAEMQLWVAHRNGLDVGRIAAILDQNHNKNQTEPAVFFGFFECENDRMVSRELFNVVLNWARKREFKRLLGPMNPTTNDECGLLVDGFDSSPQLMMTYNPRYYESLISAEGFVTAKNLLAYQIEAATCPGERLDRIAAKVQERNHNLVLRAVRRRTLASDLPKIKEIYNAAWRQNWGFIPMTTAELDFMAARLKPLLQEGLVWIVENSNEPIGFLLTMPDYNELFKPMRGRLLGLGTLGLLSYVLGWKRLSKCRVITLGVKAAYRNRGIEAVMLAECLKHGLRMGFHQAEASWILEDNIPMRRLLRSFGGKVYKTYRIYQKALP